MDVSRMFRFTCEIYLTNGGAISVRLLPIPPRNNLIIFVR